jgi:hypothetical protein
MRRSAGKITLPSTVHNLENRQGGAYRAMIYGERDAAAS